MAATSNFTFTEKALAWGVHTFTATGVMAAFMSILAIGQGVEHLKEAMVWLLIAFVIDGVDGSLARRWRVKEVIPWFNGQNIDYVIDFATYAIIPAYFVYVAGMVPPGWELFSVAAILYTSAFYYGKLGMVSDDMHFIGFPVLWNFVVFYLYFVWDLGAIYNLLLIIFLCILHFAPIKFLYPSRTEEQFGLTITITSISIIADLVLLYIFPETNLILSVFASFVALYFGIMTVYKTYFYHKK